MSDVEHAHLRRGQQDASPAPSRQVIGYDQPGLFVDALSSSISRRAPELQLCSLRELMEEDLRPDIVLLVVAPDQTHTIEDLLLPFDNIRSNGPPIPVLAILHVWNEPAVTQLIDLGVAGIILGDCSIDVVIAALRFALVGGSFAPAHMLRSTARHDVQPQRPAQPDFELPAATRSMSFTPRELEVLHRLRQGLQNKIIAYELGISESTVKVHLRNVMKKLHASNRTQVAFMLRRLPDFELAETRTPRGATPPSECAI